MVVEESIHVIFYESNNSLQERESFDDDLGLETSMGKLQIEDRRQQEEVVEDPKKEESPLALPPPQQVQGESSQDLPKDWKFVINHPQDQIIATKGKNLHQLSKVYKRSLKRFNMEEAKTMKTPMSSSIKLDMDEKGKSVNSTMYRGMIGHSLVSWHSTKQNSVALSTAEAEYIAAGLCCAQIILFGGDFSLYCAPQAWFSFISMRLGLRMAPRRETSTSRLWASALLSHLSLNRRRLAERQGWLPVVTISEPIFSTLVRSFYSPATYGLGGPILYIVRGVEIRLSPKSICRILDIPLVGLRVYEAKAWPTVPGFEPREAVQRLCGLADA
ncbi:hypothetical protein CK203_059957 [Vitis vinifera]|uniref:Uncharacterized protein n=1 Tax=Vitis vinifera TaxID=29760 RepID=A0A438GGK2_VITVI|nr:hypothetical protein CK203_059957 [Vitis vinifera]